MKKTTSSAKPASPKAMPTWNLGLLYASSTDPKMEADISSFERDCAAFAATYDVANKAYLSDAKALKAALEQYEALIAKSEFAALIYFYMLKDIDATSRAAQAGLALIDARMAKARNVISFFEITLGTIPAQAQKALLADAQLAHFKVLLGRIFNDAKYTRSIAEEKIMNLKSAPAYEMWIAANERILNVKTVMWKKKQLPLAQAMQLIPNLSTSAERAKLAMEIVAVFKSSAPVAEAELNAVFTNKKIDDEIRGFSKPFESTVLGYRNDPAVIENLIKVVTDNFSVSQRFYKLKAKLLKQKKLAYSDRAAKIGAVKAKFSFIESLEKLKGIFGAIDPKFSDILGSYASRGQIDVQPRAGKLSGAYCLTTYPNPTFVLLNHTDDLNSFTTFAHEMGHAFHGELSRAQGPIYSSYSTALAETASTLFETIALEAVFDDLSDKEKIVVLHDRIGDEISTIFRQVACFNFENDLHKAVREKGFVSHEEIAALHNANIGAYLGSAFDLKLDDGYMFVMWSHIRRFFYVYTYAYGMLVSKAMLRMYRKDPTFWEKIEQFLSAGGKESPENILREIGIDVSSPTFWQEGILAIRDDIDLLEKLTAAQGKSSKGKKR